MDISGNRFALLNEEEEENFLEQSQSSYILSAPFLNQAANDTTPWQQVPKRGAPPIRAPPLPRAGMPTAKSKLKSAISCPRGIIRSHDSRENWCGVCNVHFSTKTGLQTHMKQLPEHENYCNLCRRVFKDKNGLRNHVDNAKDHDVVCNLCLSAFKDEWGLRNHLENNYHIGHQYACMACLIGFENRQELEIHLQVSPKHTWCMTCCRGFNSQQERDEHWQETSNHKHCLQPGCEFDGPDDAALAEHIYKHHFPCDGCKLILPSHNRLKLHYETCPFSTNCLRCGQKCAGKTKCEKCEPQVYAKNSRHEMQYVPSPRIECWSCKTPMLAYSGLIKHLESGYCLNFRDPSQLLHCLGQWWYSTLYMDIDIHAQIRTGRIALNELHQWANKGQLKLFVCRATQCGASFSRLSEMVRHCEEGRTCEWSLAHLNLEGLKKEHQRVCMRKDGATAGSFAVMESNRETKFDFN